MSTNEEKKDKFIQNFREHLGDVNGLLQVFLNGHLEVEGDLDSFLNEMFFRPEYLEDARLSFAQKVQIARAYTPEDHSRPEWELMLRLNKIRNDIAHRSRHKPLKIEIERLREATAKTYLRKDVVANLDPLDVVVRAVAMCCGFLGVMTDLLKKAQGKPVEEDK
jgi:hypothetical protein